MICTTDVTQAWAEDTPEVLEIAGSLDTEDPAGLPGTAGSGKGVIGSLAEGLRGRRKNHNDIV